MSGTELTNRNSEEWLRKLVSMSPVSPRKKWAFEHSQKWVLIRGFGYTALDSSGFKKIGFVKVFIKGNSYKEGLKHAE